MTAAEPRPYRLLDSGQGRRLEAFGPWVLDRQATQAQWSRNLPADPWHQAAAQHQRASTGGGHWKFRERLPEAWVISHAGLLLEARPTPFGHVGLFPEAARSWIWLRETAGRAARPLKVLHLFAYTGGGSLALAQAGASVCHVDAARGSVEQARRNALLNHLEQAPVRWIIEDCRSFLRREQRRGQHYDGLLLDPPTYGRGRRGEVFKIEDHLPALLASCAQVMADQVEFLHLSCHTPGFTPTVLGNLVRECWDLTDLEEEQGELSVCEADSARALPSGSYFCCRRRRGE